MSEPPSGRLLIVTFIVMEGLAVVSWAVSVAGAPSAVMLAIATVMMVLSGAVFMELKSAHPAMRVIATAVVFFVVLLVVGIAADTALRAVYAP